MIFENWTDGQGGLGKSFNAYNVDYSMWQQFWTDQYGRVTEYRESERTPEGGLRFRDPWDLPIPDAPLLELANPPSRTRSEGFVERAARGRQERLDRLEQLHDSLAALG